MAVMWGKSTNKYQQGLAAAKAHIAAGNTIITDDEVRLLSASDLYSMLACWGYEWTGSEWVATEVAIWQ